MVGEKAKRGPQSTSCREKRGSKDFTESQFS